MNEIKCPRCGTVFTINETEYSQLLAQVRGAEFEKEIHERLERETALLEEKSKNELQVNLNDKDKEIADLRAQLDKLSDKNALELANALSEKDKEVQSLQNQVDKLRLEHENQLQKTVAQVERNVMRLKINWWCRKKNLNCP